jgi:putative two-component system response regulator
MTDKRGKILIVDDEPINRMLLEEYLTDEYEIIQAEDGEVAVKKIQELGLELKVILLDIIMPNLDGFGVLKFLSDYGYMGELPVILITGDNSTGIEEAAFDLGVSDFIRKPFNPPVVVKRVRNIVDLFERTKQLRQIVEEQNEELMEQEMGHLTEE